MSSEGRLLLNVDWDGQAIAGAGVSSSRPVAWGRSTPEHGVATLAGHGLAQRALARLTELLAVTLDPCVAFDIVVRHA